MTNSSKLDHYKELVLAKLYKKYDLVSDDLRLSANEVRYLSVDIRTFIQSQDLRDKIKRHGSGLNLATQKDVAELCGSQVQAFTEVFCLRSKVLGKSGAKGEPLVERVAVTEKIIDIYANHVTLAAMEKIETIGISKKNAFALTGAAIRRAILLRSDDPYAYIRPLRPEGNSLNAMQQWYNNTLSFAGKEKDSLNKWNKMQRSIKIAEPK